MEIFNCQVFLVIKLKYFFWRYLSIDNYNGKGNDGHKDDVIVR